MQFLGDPSYGAFPNFAQGEGRLGEDRRLASRPCRAPQGTTGHHRAPEIRGLSIIFPIASCQSDLQTHPASQERMKDFDER